MTGARSTRAGDDEELICWVNLDYACFGCFVGADGVVHDAAPLAHWSIGKNWHDVRSFYKRKGAEIRVRVTRRNG